MNEKGNQFSLFFVQLSLHFFALFLVTQMRFVVRRAVFRLGIALTATIAVTSVLFGIFLLAKGALTGHIHWLRAVGAFAIYLISFILFFYYNMKMRDAPQALGAVITTRLLFLGQNVLPVVV